MFDLYDRMREQGNSGLFSSYTAGGTRAARFTGVENLSYFWEDLDPLNGETYGFWERMFYGGTGAVQLIGIGTAAKQIGTSVGKSVGFFKSNCFTEGTQIVVGLGLTENGEILYDTKNIEEIQVGDLVYSYDTATGEYGYNEVTATFERNTKSVTQLTILDGHGNEQTIETTESHPFWVVTDDPDLSRAARYLIEDGDVLLYHENVLPTENGYWVEAKDLQIGDTFLGADGELSTLKSSLKVEQEGGVSVFNFEVAGNHNYFVLAKEFELGQSCVLVHNTSMDMHHSIPKFLGGAEKQDLASIPRDVHKELHKELRLSLKEKGLDLSVGGKGGSAKDWKEYFKQNSGSQRKALDAVLEASRAIDVKHGTNTVQNFWQNLVKPNTVRIYP